MTSDNTLTQAHAALPLADLRRIDELCARFEAVWAAGGQPAIEEFLGLAPEGLHGRLLGELQRTRDELQGRQPGATVSFAGESAKGGKGEFAPSRRGFRAGDLLATPIPGYEVMKELGRGGMGVVYLARQTRLKRLVALKVILAGEMATAAHLARFRAEAVAIARLKHPNVVQIHATGQHEGRPYLSLEYVEGGNLADRLAGRPQPPRCAARLLAKAARAVQAAHRKGVVHRDLKPANILIDEPASALRRLGDCTPKISDFGLAKDLEEASAEASTQGVLGTPAYMAPEQAAGGMVTAATDIFALGVVLYEMLTGQQPFQGTTILDTLEQVRKQEPVRPRRLQRSCPRDLETICLKCLEKEPQRRYATAEGLADDLTAYLESRPLAARPVGVLGKSWRWARRNPAVAGLLAAVLLASLCGTATASWFAARAQGWAATAELRAEELQQERDRVGKLAADEAQARLRAEWLAYANQVCLAQREFERKMVPKANMILDMTRPDFRSWEFAYLKSGGARTLESDDPALTLLRFPPEPAGDRATTLGSDGSVTVWQTASGRRIQALTTIRGPIRAVALGPDGRVAVAAERRLVVWEPGRDEPLFTCSEHAAAVTCVAYSPDGKRLFTGSDDQTVKVWEATRGQCLLTLEGHAAPVTSLGVSRDGKRLVTADRAGVSRLWESP